MFIVSSDGSITYGIATAEDCGGAIKGSKIDLFFNTYEECIQFGRRSCTVYILS
jgi:3D (Asp-Asp-Asp) domain-containing protein